MIEILAFLMWFMPHKLRIAIASKVGNPYRHNESEAIIWVVGRRTAFLNHARFTIRECDRETEGERS